MNSASKYIPGLGTQFFIHPDHVNDRGGAEKYIPGLGKQVMIPTACIDDRGGAEKYIPGLGKQFYISPTHLDMSVLGIILSQAAPVSTTVTITAVISGGVAPVVTKYISGTKVVADFASSGTTFTGTFDVTVNADYTVYAKDALGNETVSTIIVSSIV